MGDGEFSEQRGVLVHLLSQMMAFDPYAPQARGLIVPLCFAAPQIFACVIGARLGPVCWYQSALPLRYDFFRMVRS
jgi:hypothetical protein